MNYEDLNWLLIDVVKDIENKSKKIHCYAYLKTIRSILTAAEKSPIAPHFKEKKYYGQYNYISLNKLEKVLDNLCDEEKLTFVMHNGKKRYASIKDYEKGELDIEKKRKLIQIYQLMILKK